MRGADKSAPWGGEQIFSFSNKRYKYYTLLSKCPNVLKYLDTFPVKGGIMVLKKF